MSISLDIMNQDPEILTAASMKEIMDLTPKLPNSTNVNMSAVAERDISYNENLRRRENEFKSEVAIRNDYENEMLSLTQQMKSIALSYTDHLKNDDKILNRMQKQVEAVGTKNKDLDNLTSRFATLSWWRLIIMARIVMVLFALMVSFITFDRMSFGR